MACKDCYCNQYMQNKRGCLYMFEDAWKRLNKVCPCLDCIVQIICRDRYNKCKNFHDFLDDSFVTITPEAKAFKT